MTTRNGLTAIFAAGMMIVSAAAHADSWRRLESPHFVIYTDAPERTVRGYITQLEAYDFAANTLFGEIGDSQVDETHKYTFYYLAAIRSFKVVRPSIASDSMNTSWQSRAYGPQFFSVAEIGGDSKDRRVNDSDLAYLFRSYTAIKIRQYFSYSPPDWVTNGLEDYFMMTHIDKDKVLVGLPQAALLSDVTDMGVPGQATSADRIYPLQRIVAGDYKKGDNMRLVRYEQWILINYCLTNPAMRERFLVYLTRTRLGLDRWQAFTGAMGLTEDAFKAIYKEYSFHASPYLTYPMTIKPDEGITAKTLPDYGNDLPLMYAALKADPSKAYGAKLLATLRQMAPKFPGDDLLLRSLIIAEIDFGDPHQAMPLIEKLLAANASDSDALFLKGRMYMAQARSETADAADKDWAAARDALGQAYKLDPSNAQILAAFALAHANLKTYPDDNTVSALDLADNYSGGLYDLEKAEFDVRRDDYAAALALIGDWTNNALYPDRERAAIQAVVDGLKAKMPKAEVLARLQAFRDVRDSFKEDDKAK